MFVAQKDELKGGSLVTVIGKVSRKEADVLFIKTHLSEIPIRYKDIVSYTNDNIVVTGVVDGFGCVDEQSVDLLDVNFDAGVFNDFVSASKNYSDIF